MKTMIIPTEQLRRAGEIVAAAVQTREGSALPADARPQLEKVLGSACHGPVALEEYLAQLMEVKAAGRLRGNELLLDEIPAKLVIKDGLGVLSDEQLLRLAISPELLRELNGMVEQALQANELGEFWWDAYAVPDSAIPPGYLGDDALRRVLDDIDDTPDSPKTAAPQTSVAPTAGARPGGWSAYAGLILALAACVLIGVFLGWYIRGAGQDRNETLVANAKVEPALVRGPNDEKLQQVRVTGPFDGFIVVLALAPDRKQRVFPEFGADDKPVAAGADSDGIPVPADTTRALFVVTETPAGESIRRAFEGKNARRYSPDQEVELRRELESLLKSKGYRRIALGSASIDRQP